MESNTPLFCFTPPEGINVLAHCIRAVPIVVGVGDREEVGPISQLPEGARLRFCGDGFNDFTVRVYWEGHYYFVFLQDLQDNPRRTVAKLVSDRGASQVA